MTPSLEEGRNTSYVLYKENVTLVIPYSSNTNIIYFSLLPVNLFYLLCIKCGPGSSVGIATDYGMDGPVSNPGGDEIFRPSRPVLGPTQPPIKWVPCLSRR